MGYREDWFKENPSDHGWYTCAECGKKIRKADADIDHIIPQKYGGSDKLFNLQCLCKHCNRSKQASLSDTVPDLAVTNGKRAVNAVKKKLASVTTAAKNALTRKKKTSTSANSATKKTSASAKTATKKTSTSAKTATKKTSASTKTATKKTSTSAKTATKKK